MAGEELGEILLGGAAYPDAAIGGLAKPGYYLLQLKQQLFAVAYELADLIHKEEKTVVVGFVSKIVLDFGTESFGSEGDGVALDILVDRVIGKAGLYGFGNLNQFVESGDGKGLGIIFPVISSGLQSFLEGVQFAVFCERTLQVLSQGNVELVEAAEGVELFPQRLGEGGTVSSVAIHFSTDVEKDAVYLGVLEPDSEIPDVGDFNSGFAFRMLERVKVGYSFLQTGQGFVLVTLIDTEVEVLEEVGLT